MSRQPPPQSKFPKIGIHDLGANPQYLRRIKEVCHELRRTYRKVLGDKVATQMERIARGEVRMTMIDTGILGNLLHGEAKKSDYHMESIAIVHGNYALKSGIPQSFTVECRTLESATVDGATVYYPKSRPTVDAHGGVVPVGFTTHAIERLEERLVGSDNFDAHSYTHVLLAHGLDRVTYTHTTLTDGRDAFVIKERIGCPTATGKAVMSVGEEKAAEDGWVVRAYCPIAETSSSCLVTKSVLLPGMRGTPEAEAIDRKYGDGTADQRSKLIFENPGFVMNTLCEVGMSFIAKTTSDNPDQLHADANESRGVDPTNYQFPDGLSADDVKKWFELLHEAVPQVEVI